MIENEVIPIDDLINNPKAAKNTAEVNSTKFGFFKLSKSNIKQLPIRRMSMLANKQARYIMAKERTVFLPRMSLFKNSIR